ncbi:Metal dependent phosphohydrolase [Emericellopsis cladophorae]|uniref:Metal dependent phosphohydrolase n=1 Tax=Emericellopsis cladophorae TaxID=2686198 RepID=A0A9Q0BC19_9HYPO|nr:Metal dependent phosphohydrolase [Emericellopsis cladophorae]KAI6779105.1 Metal dependent phosphohydrolase [Emericellopsis cladophorae]
MSAVPTPLLEHVASLNALPPTPIGAGFFSVPDSAICKKAEAFVGEYLPTWMGNHAFRTYASALAIPNHAGWDGGDKARELGIHRELIFLARVLREMGFDAKDSLKSRMSLELWGGIMARKWILAQEEDLVAAGRSPELLLGGFSSHCNFTLALVVLAAGHGLPGLSNAFVHEDEVKAICDKWPRRGYCAGLSRHTKLELERKPACMFEDFLPLFNSGMFEVDVFESVQSELDNDKGGRKT